MTKQKNGSNEQVSGVKKPSSGRRRAWGLDKKPWVDFGVRWGDNTIKGGGKDKKPGAILSDVHQSSVLSAAGRRRGWGKKPWDEFGVSWGDNTIKGGCKDEIPGATLSGVHQSREATFVIEDGVKDKLER